MKRALLFALLLSCKNQQQEEKKAELKQALADKEVARVDMERARAKALALKKLTEDLATLIAEMEKKAAAVNVLMDAAEKAASKAPLMPEIEKGTAELEAMSKQADALRAALDVEEARIHALPVTCFTLPTPPECKLPADSSTKTGQ